MARRWSAENSHEHELLSAFGLRDLQRAAPHGRPSGSNIRSAD